MTEVGAQAFGNAQLRLTMKITRIALLILAIAAALYILVPGLSWAEDGAGPHKAKHSAFRSMRTSLRLGEFAQEPGSKLAGNAIRQIEVGRPTDNRKKA
jgi:hypothetical protein